MTNLDEQFSDLVALLRSTAGELDADLLAEAGYEDGAVRAFVGDDADLMLV